MRGESYKSTIFVIFIAASYLCVCVSLAHSMSAYVCLCDSVCMYVWMQCISGVYKPNNKWVCYCRCDLFLGWGAMWCIGTEIVEPTMDVNMLALLIDLKPYVTLLDSTISNQFFCFSIVVVVQSHSFPVLPLNWKRLQNKEHETRSKQEPFSFSSPKIFLISFHDIISIAWSTMIMFLLLFAINTGTHTYRYAHSRINGIKKERRTKRIILRSHVNIHANDCAFVH